MAQNSELQNRIIKIAKERYYRFGCSRVTTDEIAGEAGISKRTLYEHFPSKENLIDTVVEQTLSELTIELENALKTARKKEKNNFIAKSRNFWTSEIKTLKDISKEFLTDLSRQYPTIWNKVLRFREVVLKEYFRSFHNLGVERGLIDPNINEDILFWIKNHVVSNLLSIDFLVNQPYTFQDILHTIEHVFNVGMLTELGRQEYLKTHGS